MRYIFPQAVTAHACSRFPASLQAAPVAAPRPPADGGPNHGSAAVAVDLTSVMGGAEKEQPAAPGHRTLNESNRVHAAMGDGRKLDPEGRNVRSISYVACRRDDGLGARTPGPTLLPSPR